MPPPQQPCEKQTWPEAQSELFLQLMPVQMGCTHTIPMSTVSTQKQAPLLGHALAQPAVEQVQTPLLQTPDGQTLPQVPQLLGSVLRFTQAPLQQTVPLGQQDPLQQLPDEQELPHAPQL